jgi:hypothetical protein
MLAHQAQGAMRRELLAVIADDARSLLSAMLQRVKSKGDQRRRLAVAVDPENAAFLVRMIVVEGLRGQLMPPW